MNISEQQISSLMALKENNPEPGKIRDASGIYWGLISEGIFECIRNKKDILGFLKEERDFIDLGLVPQLVLEVEEIKKEILQKSQSNSFCKITFFSEWIQQTASKIIGGDKKDLLEKEIKLSQKQLNRLEQEIKEIRNQQQEIIQNELSSKKPAEAKSLVEIYEQLYELLRHNIKFKKAIKRGVFFTVTEKRDYCEKENKIADLSKKCDNILNLFSLQQKGNIKKYNEQIIQNLESIIDLNNNIENLKKQINEFEKKKELMPPIEIESAIDKEISYIKELMKLSAKRLRMEYNPFILSKETKYFTYKQISSCIDRILEFDPNIFHNDSAAIFGIPSIIIIPGCGNALYDWKNNAMIVPLIPPAGNFMGSIACGAIEYRLDADEDKRLIISYNKLSEREHIKSIINLKNELVKDYITWMTSEYQGYKNLSKDVRKWFEQEIAPSKNDIYIPIHLQPYILSSSESTKLLNQIEEKISKDINSASEEEIFTAGILNYQNGKFEKSLELFKNLIQKNPNHQKALYNLGFICMKLMYKKEAIKYFKDFIGINAQSWWAGVVMEHLRRLQTS